MQFLKKSVTIGLGVLAVMMLVCGCATTSIDAYKSKSADEEAVRMLLSKYAHEWNNQNTGPLLSVWHPKAEIMYGASKTTMPKKLYRAVVLNNMSTLTEIEFSNPKIKVDGDKASAKVMLTGVGADGKMVKQKQNYQLAKVDGRWFLMSNAY